MPSFDLLLPPLLGGYLFVTRFNGTSYRCASYSGYRLVFSASIFGMIFLLTAAGFLHLFELSTKPMFLHHIIVPASIVGVLMIIFGSWKVLKVNRTPVQPLETDEPSKDDEPGDHEVRRASQRREIISAWSLFFLSVTALIILIVHTYNGMAEIAVTTFTTSVFTFVIVMFVFIQWVKRESDLHGYQVTFRLGVMVVFAVGIFVICSIFRDTVREIWIQVVPFEHAGVSIIAFSIGAFLWIPANRLFPYEAAVDRLIQNDMVNGLQDIFYYAMITFRPVCLTLIDDKVYVGYVDGEIPIDGKTDDYVYIVPIASGYRNAETKHITFETFYLAPFEKAIKSGSNLSKDEIAKIIPLREIRSVGIFDRKLYAAFHEGLSEENPTGE